MFRVSVIISLLCVLGFGQTLYKSFSDVTGKVNPFTITFDGSYYYMAAAGNPEKIYKVNVSTGNVVAESPTPLADFRTLVFLWTTGQLIGKTADSGNQSSGHGVYEIDRTTLTLGNRISNVVIGIPDSAPTYYSSNSPYWGYWNTSVSKSSQTPLLEYKLYTNSSIPFSTTKIYPSSSNYPDVTLNTRLHTYATYWYYYASTTFWEGSIGSNRMSSIQSNIFPDVDSSKFLGYTDDGLAWLYDANNGTWNGFYIGNTINCQGFSLSSFDQFTCSGSLVPVKYPTTCYQTNSYFNYSDGPSSFICDVNIRELTFTRYWVIWDLVNNFYYLNQSVTVSLPSPLSSMAQSISNVQSCTSNQTLPGNFQTISTSYTCLGPVSYVDMVIQQGCPNNYTLVRQWHYTDCTGTTVYNQTVVYRDKQAPTISNPPNITVNYGQSISPPNITDDCTAPANLTISFSDTLLFDGGCVNDTHYSRIWTVSDLCNNVATVIQFISVHPPEIQIPTDVSVECAGSLPPHPNITGWAMGNGNDSVTWSDSIYVNSDCTSQNPLYIYVTRTWTVTDKCGSRTGVQHISLMDSQGPDLQVPDDVEVSCTSSTAPSFTGYANATDMCLGNLNVTYVDDVTISVQCNQDKDITRTWKVSDKCGHSVTKSQTISQVDTKAPYFVSPPLDKTIGVSKKDFDSCNPPSLNTILQEFKANATIKDICDPAPTFKISTTFNCDQLVIAWILTDACGNTNTTYQNITAILYQAPSSEGFTLAYPTTFILFALLFGGRMFF